MNFLPTLKSGISSSYLKIMRNKSIVFSIWYMASLLLSLHTTYFILHTKAYAADSTPSADIQSKLKALQTEIASRAAKLTAEVNKKLQNRSYVGVIKTKSDTSLALTARTSQRSVILNEYTEYVAQGRSPSLKSFSQGDYVAALGDVDENGVLTAKRMIKLKTDGLDKRIVWGRVVSLESQVINIQSKDEKSFKIKTNADTIFKFGKVSASFNDLKEGKAIIVVGFKNEDGSISARLVYILPYLAYSHFKSATPSAKTASPSAKEASNSNKIIKR